MKWYQYILFSPPIIIIVGFLLVYIFSYIKNNIEDYIMHKWNLDKDLLDTASAIKEEFTYVETTVASAYSESYNKLPNLKDRIINKCKGKKKYKNYKIYVD